MKKARAGIDVACPKCGTLPGWPCIDYRDKRRKERVQPHWERTEKSYRVARARIEAEAQEIERAVREAMDGAH